MAPWSPFWDHNRFTERQPVVEAARASPYARGAVTGLGVITAIAGFVEIGSIVVSRSRRRP